MKNLLKIEKSSNEKSQEQINGFDYAQVITEEDGYQKKKQFFRIKNRLYIIKAFYKTADSKIADSFFKSVKLINDEKAVSPNVPSDVKSISLPGIIEREPENLGDDKALEAKETDRRAIVIHSPMPKFRGENLLIANKGKIKLRILYSSNGKVANVEVLESSSKSLEKPAIEAAQQTIFIPAEKDGKLVSEYAIQEYGFGVSSSIFIL
jgi:TonB family protein